MIETLSHPPFPEWMGTMNGIGSRNLLLASPGGKLDFLTSGTSEPIGKKD